MFYIPQIKSSLSNRLIVCNDNKNCSVDRSRSQGIFDDHTNCVTSERDVERDEHGRVILQRESSNVCKKEKEFMFWKPLLMKSWLWQTLATEGESVDKGSHVEGPSWTRQVGINVFLVGGKFRHRNL